MNQIDPEKLISSYTIMAERTESALSNLPEGTLYGRMNRNKYPQFYHVFEDEITSNKISKFLSKSDLPFAQKLAQREYAQKLLTELKRQLFALKHVQKAVDFSALLQVYEKLPPAKKHLVNPYILPNEDYIAKWRTSYPACENRYEIKDPYTTESGEIVRSKSEKIIADKLYYKGIPYQYETSLYLRNYKTVYPDFTILNVKTRKTIYFEHFGKMDDPDYCKRTLEKIAAYQKNGYWLGDQFFFTMECSSKPIDLTLLDKMIENYFI